MACDRPELALCLCQYVLFACRASAACPVPRPALCQAHSPHLPYVFSILSCTATEKLCACVCENILSAMNKCHPTQRYYDRSRRNPKSRASQQLRELEGRERLERSRVERRLHLTTVQGAYQLPPFHSSEERKIRNARPQRSRVERRLHLTSLQGVRLTGGVRRCICAGAAFGSCRPNTSAIKQGLLAAEIA